MEQAEKKKNEPQSHEMRNFKIENNHNGYTREYPVSLEFVVQREKDKISKSKSKRETKGRVGSEEKQRGKSSSLYSIQLKFIFYS